jgi:hypothetical protein
MKWRGSDCFRLIDTEMKSTVLSETVKALAESAHEALITRLTFHFRCKHFKMFKSAICCCRMFLHRKHCFCADEMSISSRNSSSTMNGKHPTVATWSMNLEGTAM